MVDWLGERTEVLDDLRPTARERGAERPAIGLEARPQEIARHAARGHGDAAGGIGTVTQEDDRAIDGRKRTRLLQHLREHCLDLALAGSP
jgi:hypothetical protein